MESAESIWGYLWGHFWRLATQVTDLQCDVIVAASTNPTSTSIY
jgi:hypothetical protein